jgi:Ca-activated chloride channel family protein
MSFSRRLRAITDRGLIAATALAFFGVVLAGCNRTPKPNRSKEPDITPGPAVAFMNRPDPAPKATAEWNVPVAPAPVVPMPAQPMPAQPMPFNTGPMQPPIQSLPPPTIPLPPPYVPPMPPMPKNPFGNQGQGQGIVGLGGGAPGGQANRGQQRGNNMGMVGGMGGGMMGMGGGAPGGGGGVATAPQGGSSPRLNKKGAQMAQVDEGERPRNRPTAASGEDTKSNTEKYGLYRENEFRSPRVAALSTFSADVNTASYANVRRFLLDQNRLPVKDAVFLAEFVNYFPYSYAQPKTDDPVAFHLELGPCPWDRTHHLVRVGLQSKTIDREKMPPRNLVFLVDTSGSMDEPNRLPLVQQSLALLIDTLGPNDTVSLVTYAGSSRIALTPTKGSNKKAIRDAVNQLNAHGSTNGEGGIKTAYDLATRSFVEGGVNRVILCTDGDFNVGATSEGELVRLIEERRRSGVFLTILGYGAGNYSDHTLKQLANHGNGHHAYIDTIDEAKKVFVEQGGALACVAKDVKFQVEFNPAKVAGYRLLGYENRLLKDEDFKNDAKDAGDLGSGHQVTVLYEIVPVGVKVDLPGVDPLKYQPVKDAAVSDEWLTVKMRYKHPDADVSKELSEVLKGEAKKELSDDFRFAAATASFALLLRDSPHNGVMTYSGVLEEAQGCVGPDPNGHRKGFIALVKKAKSLTTTPKVQGAAVN